MIKSKPLSKEGYANFDKIFSKKKRVKGKKSFVWQNGRIVEVEDKVIQHPYMVMKVKKEVR